MDHDDEEEMSFTEFCDEYCADGEAESEPFLVLSASDVVNLMKTETEKVCEIVNVSVVIFKIQSRYLIEFVWFVCSYLQRSCGCF